MALRGLSGSSSGGAPFRATVKIRVVMPVGCFIDMPRGREGYLLANDLGFSEGVEHIKTT